jgi:putative transposase
MERKAERRKEALFNKTREKGLLWSYDDSVRYSPALDRLLIETVLQYGDFSDLQELFTLYRKRTIQAIWKSSMVHDLRFKKLNYFLARVFFKMDVEADFFKGGMSEREKKLRAFFEKQLI